MAGQFGVFQDSVCTGVILSDDLAGDDQNENGRRGIFVRRLGTSVLRMATDDALEVGALAVPAAAVCSP